jgi:hypothetical protein
MFKLIPNPTFTADVSLTRPGEDVPGKVKFTFKALGNKDFKAWLDGAQPANNGGAVAADADFLGQVVTDWDGPVDETDAAVPFSAPAFAGLLDAYPASGLEIYTAYLKARMESRAGN